MVAIVMLFIFELITFKYHWALLVLVSHGSAIAAFDVTLKAASIV